MKIKVINDYGDFLSQICSKYPLKGNHTNLRKCPTLIGRIYTKTG
jgi:hypothetical protein